MESIAFLFPGQGAQYVGMGKDFFDNFEEVRKFYQNADDVAGFCLSKICFEGPEDKLTETRYAQAAIFVTSLAILKVIKIKHPQIEPSAACGLSLGEWTALVALGSIGFEDGLKLVLKRGQLMNEACVANPGTMASVIGLSLIVCNEIAKEAGCELANINSPEQVVLSGTVISIEKACELAKARGAKKVIPLKVSGAFHSKLMEPARIGLLEALDGTVFHSPSSIYIPNITGECVREGARIKDCVTRQVTGSVQWVKTIQTLVRDGCRTALEIGPGTVLKGLGKRIDNSLQVSCVSSLKDLDSLNIISSQV